MTHTPRTAVLHEREWLFHPRPEIYVCTFSFVPKKTRKSWSEAKIKKFFIFILCLPLHSAAGLDSRWFSQFSCSTSSTQAVWVWRSCLNDTFPLCPSSYDGGLPQNFILEVTSLTTLLGKVAKHEVFMIDNGISTMNDQVSDLNRPSFFFLLCVFFSFILMTPHLNFSLCACALQQKHQQHRKGNKALEGLWASETRAFHSAHSFLMQIRWKFPSRSSLIFHNTFHISLLFVSSSRSLEKWKISSSHFTFLTLCPHPLFHTLIFFTSISKISSISLLLLAGFSAMKFNPKKKNLKNI